MRAAACIWLASLVSFTGRQAALLQRLPEVQEAFGQLLGDTSEAVQDIAARGISAVYRLGGESDRQALLNALVSALQGPPSSRFLCSHVFQNFWVLDSAASSLVSC